ncbi:hypothetical protein ACFQZE_11640 [Paenibacillus sp. GCM10027627]|uniref:hypothetical protein n=1 Tax=unclassified Paenibacillus TaxID=185978 RepID=UPI003627B6DE
MTLSKLEEMKSLCGGNPSKIAEYKAAREAWYAEIQDLFREDEGNEYAELPAESYVEEMEARAKQSGDARDIRRAQILRDNRTYHVEDIHYRARDWLETRTKLSELVSNGGKVRKADVNVAYKLARQNSTVDMRVLYTQIKRAYDAQLTE